VNERQKTPPTDASIRSLSLNHAFNHSLTQHNKNTNRHLSCEFVVLVDVIGVFAKVGKILPVLLLAGQTVESACQEHTAQHIYTPGRRVCVSIQRGALNPAGAQEGRAREPEPHHSHTRIPRYIPAVTFRSTYIRMQQRMNDVRAQRMKKKMGIE
jgi:hypothetical protein